MRLDSLNADEDTRFELKSLPDTPGMARLQIDCLVSIPVGIRILACLMEGAAPADYPSLAEVAAAS